jgi:NNP family nitrate/nitrite transporter-like MFS transporter
MKMLPLLLFWGLWYLNFSTRTVLSPLLPIIEDEFTITHALAGSIFTFLSIGFTITLLLTALLAARIGYKKCIALGFLISAVSLFSLKCVATFSSLALAAFFIGLGAGFYIPSAIPLLTEVFAPKNWGKVIALHDTGATFSILSIPVLTAIAMRFFDWRTLFVILGTSCLVLLVFFWLLSPDPHPQRERQIQFTHVLRRRDLWIIAVPWLFATANSLGLYNLIPLFLVKEKGIDLGIANSIFGLSRIGGLFASVLIGFLVDRFGAKRIIFAVLLTTALSTVGIAVSPIFPLLIAMLTIQATVSAGFFPAAFVAISKLTNLNERGIFTGITTAFGVVFGLGVTPAILGAAADVWGFQPGILVLGVLTLFSCGLIRSLGKI